MVTKDEIKEKNRKQLQKLIKHCGGQKAFLEIIRKYDKNFKTQKLHNWLHSNGPVGLPYPWCLLFDKITDGKFGAKNLRYDLIEPIRKAL